MIDEESFQKIQQIGAPLSDARLSASHPIIDLWLQAVNAHAVTEVCQLYAEDAILLPTLSDIICDTPERIRKYFEFFLARPGITARLSSCYVQQYSEVKIDSGIYEFNWQEGGATKSARARFTFVIRDGRIVEHHSSLSPL
jgi:hypothetical protein